MSDNNAAEQHDAGIGNHSNTDNERGTMKDRSDEMAPENELAELESNELDNEEAPGNDTLAKMLRDMAKAGVAPGEASNEILLRPPPAEDTQSTDIKSNEIENPSIEPVITTPPESNYAALVDRGIEFQALFTTRGSQENLKEAIACFREALALRPMGAPGRDDALANLGQALFQKFLLEEDLVVIDEACLCYRTSLELRPPGHEYREAMQNNLGVAYLNRYKRSGELLDLEYATKYHREVLLVRSPGHPFHGLSLINLANCLLNDFEYRGGLMELEEAVACYRKGIYLQPIGHPSLPAAMLSFANSLSHRFKKRKRMEDLDEAIDHYKRARSFFSPASSAARELLNNWANALVTRFDGRRDLADIEEAITLSRECLLTQPIENCNRSSHLSNLGGILWYRFKHVGSYDDLEEAIGYHQHASGLAGSEDPSRSRILSNYSTALISRFELRGDYRDLEHAITNRREVVELQLRHPDPSSLNDLAFSSMTRYEQKGMKQDLEEAIELHRNALDLRPVGHEDRSLSLHHLAYSLVVHYQLEGNRQSLEEAIGYYEESQEPRVAGMEHDVLMSNNLDMILCDQGKLDATDVIERCRNAVELQKPTGVYRYILSSNLANSLLRQFQYRGHQEYLEEAIAYCRITLEQTSSGHIHRSTSLNNLAVALQMRYWQMTDTVDIDEAIRLHREALQLRPVGHPRRSQSLNNLAACLYGRYDMNKDIKIHDLDQAIEYHREVLSLRGPGNLYRSDTMSNLATCLQARYEYQGDFEALFEAIGYQESALALRPLGHQNRYMSLSRLASLLLDRFRVQGNVDDLGQAIKHYQSALALVPCDHPDVAELKVGLASGYIAESKITGDQSKLSDASNLFTEAVDHSPAGVPFRFIAAMQWWTATDLDDSTILRALKKCLELSDRCILLKPSITLRHKHGFLMVPPSLAHEAASFAIKAGRIETAIEFLEQGRSMLWSQLERYRTFPASLRSINHELAEEFERLSFLLQHSSLSPTRADFPDISVEHEAAEYRRLLEKWEATVDSIRQLSGFESFLEMTPFATLKQASANGTIIIINITHTTSDAIIICRNGDLHVINLQEVRPEFIDNLSSQFSEALLPETAERNRNSKILNILRILWEVIVEPIVKRLQEIGIEHSSRIWWCPTSKLAFLPLHAAGPHRGKQLNLPDIYVSSYTPTLSSLIRASTNENTSRDRPKLLIVAQPEALNQPTIKEVKREVSCIQEVFPSAKVLLGEDANREAVISGIESHQWVHFACHGEQDLVEPFKSHFSLYNDGSLSLLEIIMHNLPNADLAYTAACHSAAVDKAKPDEVIHIAAGLQFSGFKGVIGTLYPMADEDAPIIARSFYQHMLYDEEKARTAVDFRNAARALNLAIKTLKNSGVPLFRWINFIHIGA